MSIHKCCAQRWSGFHTVTCGKPGKIEREGNFYCGRHDPVRVRERQDARDAKFEAQYAERMKAHAASDRRKQMQVEFAGALIGIAAGHNDARGYAQRLVAKYQDILDAASE